MSNDLEQYDYAPSTEARLRSIIAEQEARFNDIADLAANVRHGINNPLAGIIGQVQILLRSELTPELRRQIESIEQLALRVRDTAALLRSIQRSPEKQDALNWPEK
jgi:signal transduction histidine kinase